MLYDPPYFRFIMTYQVLARKYRPQKFTDVVGQEHITTTLSNAISTGRLHHAYLFTGARGIGKTTVARILAKALNCKNKDNTEPCNSCVSCKDITNGTSLDVQEIDGASNTGVDDVRELREHARYMPSSATYKIYIIDEVHMLSTSAFNALLKMLEEPPAHVIFMFATTEAHKIPVTILSRCQRYDFKRIPAKTIAATLKTIAGGENVKIDDNSLHLIAREATGSLRDAESLFDQAIAFSGNTVTLDSIKSMLGFLDRKLLFDTVWAIVNRDPKSALSALEKVFESGADISRFTMDILDILRDMLVFAECNTDSCIDLPSDEIDELKKMLSKTTPATLHVLFSACYKIADDVARQTNPKMLLEVGLVRLCHISDVKSIEEIIAKIDSLADNNLSTSLTKNEDRKISSEIVSRSEIAPKPVSHTPTFEPVLSQTDVDAEKKWQEFLRFVVKEKPQVASIFQHGSLLSIDNGVVKMAFDNPLYSDMLLEEDRKRQIENLFESFFKKRMRLATAASGEQKTGQTKADQKRSATRDALGNDIVRQATDILNARIYEVKVEDDK